MHFYLTSFPPIFFAAAGFVLPHPSGSPPGEAHGPMDEEEQKPMNQKQLSIRSPRHHLDSEELLCSHTMKTHPQILPKSQKNGLQVIGRFGNKFGFSGPPNPNTRRPIEC